MRRVGVVGCGLMGAGIAEVCARAGKAVAESLHEDFEEPWYAAPPLLNRMVDAGLLGRKAGRGFFPYDEGTRP